MLVVLEHGYCFLHITSIRELVRVSIPVGRQLLELRAMEISAWFYCDPCRRFYVKTLFDRCFWCLSSLRPVLIGREYVMRSLYYDVEYSYERKVSDEDLFSEPEPLWPDESLGDLEGMEFPPGWDSD